MSQQNVEIVRSIYEAFAQRDEVTPFKYYAPDIEWDTSGGVEFVGGSTVYHGHEGVHAFFHDLLQAFRRFEYRPLEFTPIGDQVLVTVGLGSRQCARAWRPDPSADVHPSNQPRGAALRS